MASDHRPLRRAVTPRGARTDSARTLLLSVCPICFDQSGLLADGARAGAALLALALLVVVIAFARFAWRVGRA